MSGGEIRSSSGGFMRNHARHKKLSLTRSIGGGVDEYQPVIPAPPTIPSLPLPVCVSECLCVSVCVRLCLCLCLSLYISVSLSLCVSDYLWLYLTVSLCLFVCICLSLCVSLWLSLSFSVSLCLSFSLSLSLCLSLTRVVSSAYLFLFILFHPFSLRVSVSSIYRYTHFLNQPFIDLVILHDTSTSFPCWMQMRFYYKSYVFGNDHSDKCNFNILAISVFICNIVTSCYLPSLIFNNRQLIAHHIHVSCLNLSSAQFH